MVIEMFGDFYHGKKCKTLTWVRTEKGRIAKFKEFGFSCLVIWEREMATPELVVSKIKMFAGEK